MKAHTAPVVVHLSPEGGSSTQPLDGSSWTLGTADDADIRVPSRHGSPAAAFHATLRREGDDYLLRAQAPHRVWVNGRSGSEHQLRSGDLVEFGAHGPVLRFRLMRSDKLPFKSLREALADGWAGAAQDAGSAAHRIYLFVKGVAFELATQISPLARGALTAVILSLLVTILFLAVRGERLEDQLAEEAHQVAGLEELLAASDARRVTERDLDEIRRDLESRIASTAERVDYLEERASAAERTIAEVSRSIVFIQASYGFRDPASGLPVRLAVDDTGAPIPAPDGGVTFSTGGDGPLVEAFYTGSAFVATEDGLLVTNRHVALPWEYDYDAQTVIDQGLEPTMVRMVGYLMDIAEAFEVELAAASDEADLAVLRTWSPPFDARALSLDPTAPQGGEPVIVMGFPTGIQAMLARADSEFLDRIQYQQLGFWALAQQLAESGQIGPLATRGIISQVTGSTIVYDAETTSGGSGGPVLSLEGRVVAVTSAVLPQFGGSNLGVPAALVIDLLERARGGAPVETSP